MQKILFYLPRVLSILIVAFFALFILEGLSPGFGWQDSLAHFLLTLVVLGVTIAAWKRPEIGGWLFVLLGLAFLLMSFRSDDWWSGAIIGGVPLLTGILFLIQGFGESKRKKEPLPDNENQ